MYKREVTSSESKDNMGRPGKRLSNFMTLKTKSSNNNQKSRFSINNITKQNFRKLLKYFDNPYYLGYKRKQVHNNKTEAYFFLIKQITNTIKSEKHIRLLTNFFKIRRQ